MKPIQGRLLVRLVITTMAIAMAAPALAQERPAPDQADRAKRLEDLKSERADRLEKARQQREELLQKREALRNDPEYRKRLAAERAARRKAAPRKEARNSRNSLHRLQRQIAIAENRHNQMLARMTVIRELAEAAGDTEAIARVDALMEQENRQGEQEQARQAKRIEQKKSARARRSETRRPAQSDSDAARPATREQRPASPREER